MSMSMSDKVAKVPASAATPTSAATPSSAKYPASKMGSDIATMSESQFSASLDALLDLDVTERNDSSGADADAGANANALVVRSQSQPKSLQSDELRKLGCDQHDSENDVSLSQSPVAAVSMHEELTVSASPRPSASSSVSSVTVSAEFPVPQLFGKAVPISFQPLTGIAIPLTAQKGDPIPPCQHDDDQLPNRKRPLCEGAVSEDEGDRQRRRQDRNAREQQRSRKITDQIGQLRGVLQEANLSFKPDKYTTLSTAVEYVKSLQDKSRTLDSEHKNLIDTISKTSEVINGVYVPAEPGKGTTEDTLTDKNEDENLVFVGGLDYKTIFSCCPFASAISTIDGRFVDCSSSFEQLTGYSRSELLPREEGTALSPLPGTTDDKNQQERNLSLFNILKQDDMQSVFEAMSEMLRIPFPSTTTDDFWSGAVRLNRSPTKSISVKISLVRTSMKGRPRFFNFTFIPE